MTTRELDAAIGRHEEQLRDLKREQERQADAIDRLEEKLDGLQRWTYGILAGVIIPVADVLLRRLGS